MLAPLAYHTPIFRVRPCINNLFVKPAEKAAPFNLCEENFISVVTNTFKGDYIIVPNGLLWMHTP